MLFKTNKLMEYAARHRVPILHPESVEASKDHCRKSHQPQRS